MKQPETIVVAEYLESIDEKYAAKEMRRLQEANQAMLEVLKEIVEMWDAFVPTDLTAEPHLKARAAIAKGEQQ